MPDEKTDLSSETRKLQSPYGGIGASDMENLMNMFKSYVSITLRCHRCLRQVFINNDVSKPFAGVYERKVVKYIVNELLMLECYLLSVLYTVLHGLSTCTAKLF